MGNEKEVTNAARRALLKAGGALTGVAAFGAMPFSSLAAPAVHTGPRGLMALSRDMKGRLLFPWDDAYPFAAWPNNARWAGVHPVAVAMCADADDVQRCVRTARDMHIPFRIRSGGHNYAGFSTARGLLIDVKAMNEVKADWDKGIAVVSGGANNDDVAAALRKRNFAIPSGRCPTVGTSGLVLGGGWGFAATKSGLTCDSLIATELVTANAQKRFISDDYERELFWAVRGGGGGNFGVHTSFTFKLHEVTPVTTFNIVWQPGKQVELLTRLQEVQRSNARTISTRTKARPQQAGANPKREELVVETLGLYWGKEEALREIMAPLFALQPRLTEEIYYMDYWRARDSLMTDDPVGMYDLKSSYIAESLSEDGIDTMLHWMTQWPGGSLRQDNMGILFAVGGAVNDLKPDDTAYVHRQSNYIFEMETAWAPIDSADTVRRQREWLGNYFDAMVQYVQPQSYVNFPNRELKNWAEAYYATNLPRLSEAKRHYDPDNIFKFEQSIPPAPKRKA